MRGVSACVLLLCAGCTCVSSPDVKYACEGAQDCEANEQCIAMRCTLVMNDAGTNDAGANDAGSTDSGTPDSGQIDAGTREDCTNNLDDDGDLDIDCDDDECTDAICRASTSACDPAEHCVMNNAFCPQDQRLPPTSACDDGNLCTLDSECLDDGGCGGGKAGGAVSECMSVDGGGIHNLLHGATCPALCTFAMSVVRFREIPGAPPLPFDIYSTTGVDLDGGTACTDCGDWFLTESTVPPPPACHINRPMFRVMRSDAGIADAGLIAIYQYRSLEPFSAFGDSPVAPPGYITDTTNPIFYACPP